MAAFTGAIPPARVRTNGNGTGRQAPPLTARSSSGSLVAKTEGRTILNMDQLLHAFGDVFSTKISVDKQPIIPDKSKLLHFQLAIEQLADPRLTSDVQKIDCILEGIRKDYAAMLDKAQALALAVAFAAEKGAKLPKLPAHAELLQSKACKLALDTCSAHLSAYRESIASVSRAAAPMIHESVVDNRPPVPVFSGATAPAQTLFAQLQQQRSAPPAVAEEKRAAPKASGPIPIVRDFIVSYGKPYAECLFYLFALTDRIGDKLNNRAYFEVDASRNLGIDEALLAKIAATASDGRFAIFKRGLSELIPQLIVDEKINVFKQKVAALIAKYNEGSESREENALSKALLQTLQEKLDQATTPKVPGTDFIDIETRMFSLLSEAFVSEEHQAVFADRYKALQENFFQLYQLDRTGKADSPEQKALITSTTQLAKSLLENLKPSAEIPQNKRVDFTDLMASMLALRDKLQTMSNARSKSFGGDKLRLVDNDFTVMHSTMKTPVAINLFARDTARRYQQYSDLNRAFSQQASLTARDQALASARYSAAGSMSKR